MKDRVKAGTKASSPNISLYMHVVLIVDVSVSNLVSDSLHLKEFINASLEY